MRLKEIVKRLDLEVRSGIDKLENEVKRGYSSDLLSDVIANGKAADIWITLQTHQNIVAVASLKDLSGIILVNGREPDGETVEKAEEEAIPIMVSKLPAFELVGRLHNLGIRGVTETPAEPGDSPGGHRK